MTVSIHHGDSREVLKTLADASVDSVVCDPPYALVSVVQRFGNSPRSETTENVENPYGRTGRGFMGQKWDTGETAFAVTFWTEVYRVLKPGGHVVAFSGTRTYHRLACAVEDAGFEIRDMLSWLYGSGFPKSHDVSKGIDKRGGASIAWFGPWLRTERDRRGITQKSLAAYFPSKTGGLTGCVANWELGLNLPTVEQFNTLCRVLDLPFAEIAEAERQVVGQGYRVRRDSTVNLAGKSDGAYDLTASSSGEAAAWEGWGTALKPACEPIVLARKPLDSTVAANVLAHGTGALNIDGCRVGAESTARQNRAEMGYHGGNLADAYATGSDAGRWPANVVHDGSDEVVGAFPETSSGSLTAAQQVNGGWAGTLNVYGTGKTGGTNEYAGDTGSAARFFYAAKPDDLCGLCGCPSGVFSGKPSPCNANTAEPSSPTENTQSAATAPCDAVGSQLPVREVKNQASSGLATDAELPSSRHRQAGRDTAAEPAATPGLSSLAQNVKSAGNLCGSCATAIAQSLAATRLGQNPELQPSPVSISERSAQILRQHLALYVEGRESTDTILTTPSLRQLLGSVFHAIAESTLTTEEKPSASSEKSKRLWYGSKADATDRLGSKHPTVKPTDLMRWLVRLVTPPGGTVLDPFAGSGSTGVACIAEGFDAILIEREAEYVADIRRRIAWAQGEGRLTAQEMAKKPDLGLEGLSLFE